MSRATINTTTYREGHGRQCDPVLAAGWVVGRRRARQAIFQMILPHIRNCRKRSHDIGMYADLTAVTHEMQKWIESENKDKKPILSDVVAVHPIDKKFTAPHEFIHRERSAHGESDKDTGKN